MTPFVIWEKITPVIEIIILWFVFYRILVFFEGTRAFQVLRGLTYLLIAFLVSKLFGLDTINWLLTKIFGLSIIALMIIFHQELRQGLARLGQQHLFSITLGESEIIAIIEELSNAIFKLSKQNIGALIAIERVTKLNTYIESGVSFDSKISSELVQSIFNPHSPLHDGGIIIRNDRIVASACLFPLTDNPSISKIIGTRHRAALGISEQTDAIAILVSEETGEVCLTADGKFISIKNDEELVNTLKSYLVSSNNNKKKKK